MSKKSKKLMQIVRRVEEKSFTDNMNMQINVRISNEENLKLEKIKRETGMTTPNLIRSFINEGEVNVLYDAKKVISQLVNIHNSFNEYSHHVLEETDSLKQIFSQIDSKLENTNTNSALEALVVNATFLTDQMIRTYRDTNKAIEMEMKNIVDIHSRK